MARRRRGNISGAVPLFCDRASDGETFWDRGIDGETFSWGCSPRSRQEEEEEEEEGGGSPRRTQIFRADGHSWKRVNVSTANFRTPWKRFHGFLKLPVETFGSAAESQTSKRAPSGTRGNRFREPRARRAPAETGWTSKHLLWADVETSETGPRGNVGHPWKRFPLLPSDGHPWKPRVRFPRVPFDAFGFHGCPKGHPCKPFAPVARGNGFHGGPPVVDI